MKKILIIISTLEKNGGAERVASLMSRIKGYEIEYLNFYQRNNEYKLSKKIYNLKEGFKSSVILRFLKIFSRAKEISKIVKRDSIDICISHMEESNIPLIVSKLLYRNRAKIVLYIHNNLGIKHRKLYLLILTFLYSISDKIVGVSKFIINDFPLRKLLINKYTVIYNPIDLKKISMDSLSKIKDHSKDVDIVTVGRLHPQKNQKFLLEVENEIEGKYKIDIIGEGPLRDNLDSYIREHRLSTKIRLLGFQKNVFKYLKQAKIFVITSKYEGFGLAIVEAMACGLPVISIDCPYGPREILSDSMIKKSEVEYGKYGILVQPGNKEAFIEALEEIINNKTKYNHYSKQSFLRAEDFDIVKICGEWEVMLNSLY